jgi:tetratricopeptide (TPR) repeat protein
VVENDFAGNPIMSVLREAYGAFRSGQVRRALDLLQPVLAEDRANRSTTAASVVWGLAGDCHFKLDQPEDGFRAYQRSIALNPDAGCLTLFACQVAKHRRGRDAEDALRCLEMARDSDRRAFKKHPIHVLLHSLKPTALWHRFVKIPIARRRLIRLAVPPHSER